jgi:N-acetylglucosamine kinase-like BadF-type ATPase
MDIKDAALVVRCESAEQPAVAAIAQAVYERLVNGDPVDYRLLDDLVGEASGKGVLRALHAKYSPVAYEAIIGPILAEIGRQKPIRSQRYAGPADTDSDPLLASTWPSR